MALKIKVDIVSAHADLFSGQADMVFVPAVQGDIGVLPRHAPLLSTLKAGEVRVKIDAEREESFYISGGIVEIQPHTVTILADVGLRTQELDELAALSVKQRDEAFLANTVSQPHDLHLTVEIELRLVLAQLQAIQRFKSRQKHGSRNRI